MSWGFIIKTYKLYVLYLEYEKFYVGISRNVQKRFDTHKAKQGAKWTKKYSTIGIVYERDTGVYRKAEAEIQENQLTIKLMKCFGVENVRGGDYCQVDLSSLKDALGDGLIKQIEDGNYSAKLYSTVKKRVDKCK